MLLRITNGLERLSDSALIAKVTNILAGMGGNPNFASPTPTLVDIQAAKDAFEASLATAQSGGSYDKLVKNEKRTNLIDLMHSLSYYVLFIANGDRVVAASSNFTVAKEPAPAPELTVAQNLQLSDGAQSGDMDLAFDKVAGARSYVYQITEDPLTENSVWTSIAGTVRKATFHNLKPGVRYLVRVMCIGTNGQALYSQPVSRVAQ